LDVIGADIDGIVEIPIKAAIDKAKDF